MQLSDKIVVITGASKGFGKALARAFIASGAKVIISGSNTTELGAAAQELGADQCKADVTSPDEVRVLADYAIKKYDHIDIWINNAGIQIAPGTVETVEIPKLRQLFDVNYFGYFYGCQAVLPHMRRQNSGSIININSTAGLSGKSGLSAYVSSKFAVKGLTESLREEVKTTNIAVYGIFPGGMQTEIYHEQYPADFDEYMSVGHAIQKVMANLTSAAPELDLIIRRPGR